MSSDAKLPIPSYHVAMCGFESGWDLKPYDGISEELCKADDVRGLVERMEKAEAHAARLQQHIDWANREYAGEHDAVDAEIAASGEGVPDVVYSMGKLKSVLAMATKTAKRRASRLKAAEAHRERLIALLRRPMEDSTTVEYDDAEGPGCFFCGLPGERGHTEDCEAAQVLAEITKETP